MPVCAPCRRASISARRAGTRTGPAPTTWTIKINELREITDWEKPIYVKVGATRTYYDVKLAVHAGADLVVVDGMQGGTAATQEVFIEHVGIPTLAAARRLVQALQELGVHRQVQLIVSGGIRSGADVAKALALGADAVAIGTAALIALGDQHPRYAAEYEKLGSASGFYDDFQDGRPRGHQHQDPELAARFDPVEGGRRLANYLRVMTMEAQTIARACGKAHVRHLEPEDLVAVTIEAAAMARVPLAGADWIPGRRRDDGRRRHRRGRNRGCRRRMGAGPARRHQCACGRAQYRRLRDDRQVQRHHPLPLRRQLAGRHGGRRGGGVREGRGDLRHRHRLPPDGYVVGVGEPDAESLRKSLASQRAVGVQTEEIDAAEVASLWPFADLSPFAAFAWEARGGYGDAYRTAQAFAAAARAAGARIRQGATVAGLVLDGDRVTGVRLADRSEFAPLPSSSRRVSGPGRCWHRTGSTRRSGRCANRS